MDKYFKSLTWFEKKWGEHPKDEVFTADTGKRKGYAVAFETGGLRALLGTTMGPKGGITSFLVIVDPAQDVEVDRLVCCDFSIVKTWISMGAHIHVHQEKKEFCVAIPKLLLDTMVAWKADPALARTQADVIGFGQTSIPTLQGGAVNPR